MKIKISGKDMTVPQRVYSHAEHKINELEMLFCGAPEAFVIFSIEDGKYVMELTIYSGTTIIRAEEKTFDMMVCVDAAVSSIRRQLRQNRTKLAEHLNENAFEKDPDGFFLIPEINETVGYQVVRSKEFEFGSMTTEDAILQMNLIGHAFFAFRNADRDNAFCVVYRRNDGGYGVLVDKA